MIVDTVSDSTGVHTLKNYVESFVRMLIDGHGYLECRGYDLEIISVVEPEGQHAVFGVEVEALKSSRAAESPVNMTELWKLLISGPESAHLQRALGDLREAIRTPHDTGFFCYRAVESMRQSFVEPKDGGKTKPSWERMSSALRIDQSYIMLLERFGKPQRHGETPYMSGDERIRALKSAWRVVDRYIEYSRRSRAPLPACDFELLRES